MKYNTINIALFILCLGLLAFSGVGFAHASLKYYSDYYKAEMEMKDIGVSLKENDKIIAWRNYQGDGLWDTKKGKLLSGIEEPWKPDQSYACRLSVQNTGKIGEYVRVTLYQYWLDKNDLKTASPENIHIHYIEDENWVIDKEAQTSERTVLYYKKRLKPGETSSEFAKAIHVSAFPEIMQKETVKKGEKEYTQYTPEKSNQNLRFVIEAKVDAIQEHNANDAALSSWGQNVIDY